MSTPIAHARSMLLSLQRSGQNVISVGFSGGKDSAVVLDLCVQVFGQRNVYPFNLYWIKGLECDQRIMDQIVSRYPDMPEVESIPHYGLVDAIKTCLGRPFSTKYSEAFQSRSLYTLNDTERIARRRATTQWIAYGHRMADSLQRRGMLNKVQGIWRETSKGRPVRRIYPIFDWSPRDVFSYLKFRKIPIPDMYGKSYINTSGVALGSTTWLLYIKKHWPNDFARVKKLFPRIEDPIFRDMVREKYQIDHAADKTLLGTDNEESNQSQPDQDRSQD